jgi:SAM-dependent methyltransferase
MTTGVATYYERLGRWNRAARLFRYGGGHSTLTVHRALADPRAQGRPTFTRLHDLLLAHLSGLRNPHVLDAGCGLGGTMLALSQAIGATCIGVTLSRSQADTANAAAARLGIAAHVSALVQSFDSPPAGPFNLVVAIESLAHSPDPARSVAALANVLAPGGHFVIVDDMPEADAVTSTDFATFTRGWQCPVVWPAANYGATFRSHGLTVLADVDLTPESRPRSHAHLNRLMGLNRLAYFFSPSPVQQVMDSHLGGLALERLTRNGLVRYRLLVARRPELRVF